MMLDASYYPNRPLRERGSCWSPRDAPNQASDEFLRDASILSGPERRMLASVTEDDLQGAPAQGVIRHELLPSHPSQGTQFSGHSPRQHRGSVCTTAARRGPARPLSQSLDRRAGEPLCRAGSGQ